jgi:hypothetical protein
VPILNVDYGRWVTGFTQKITARKSLKNMEPMSGLEPLTYALRMRKRRMKKVTDEYQLGYMAVDCYAVGPSKPRRFVSTAPLLPQLYSQIN